MKFSNRTLIRVTLLLGMLFYSYPGQCQVLLDSVRLMFAPGKISKVVAKPYGNGRMVVSWQAETDTSQVICIQIFDMSGHALTVQDTVARNYYYYPYNRMDFDVATSRNEKSVVVWSQWDPIFNRYQIRGQAFSSLGDSIAGFQFGETTYPHVRASMNSQGEVAVFWQVFQQSKMAVVQLMNPDFQFIGASHDSYFNVTLSSHTNPLHLTDSTQYTLAYLNDFYWSYSGHIRRFNVQGVRLSALVDNIYDGGPMHAMESSFRYGRSLLTYSKYDDVYPNNPDNGSHLWVINPVTQIQNHLKLDDTPSDIMQIDQDEEGNVFTSWLTAAGEIKCQFLTSSLQPTDEPLHISKGQGYVPGSLDAWLTAGRHEGFVVHAGNDSTLGMTMITLERFWFHPRLEIEETALNLQRIENQRLEKILSVQDGFIIFWREYNASSDKSAIYSQRIDKDLKAMSAPERLVYADVTQAIDFDVDNDDDGNYYLVRTEIDYHDLGASSKVYLNQYNPDGTLLFKDSVVNEPFDWSHSIPNRTAHVAANKNGDVLITWATQFALKARMRRNGVVSDIITLIDCCVSGDGTKSVLSMNESGKFVVAERAGYYGLRLLIFDANANLIKTVTNEVLNGEFSEYNMELTNQDKIVLTWTLDNGYELKTKVVTRLLDGTGEPIREPYVIQEEVDNFRKPALSSNDQGEYCIVYRADEFQMMEFTAEGQPKGTHTRVNAYTSVSESEVFLGSNGDILVSWFDYNDYALNDCSVILKYFPKGSTREPDNFIQIIKEITLTQGDTLRINDNIITRAGQFSEFYTNVLGQDSIVTYIVNVIGVANAAPSGLQLTAEADNLKLIWNADANSVAGYFVYRGTSSDVGNATLLSSSTSDYYHDFNINFGTVYYYWLRGVNVSGIVSDFSTPVHGSLSITGLEDIQEKITVWPNPTRDRLYFSNLPANALTRVTIFDITGRSQILPIEANDSYLDISRLSAGLYHLNLCIGNTRISFKVMKSN